jgi:hypothetical protein
VKDIARRLTEMGVMTARCKKWSSVTVSLTIDRGVIMGMDEARLLKEKFIQRKGVSIYSPRAQKHRHQSTHED